jgi:hypothetical protein
MEGRAAGEFDREAGDAVPQNYPPPDARLAAAWDFGAAGEQRARSSSLQLRLSA